MFEDDLGDDFLTSWKPTKMDINVGLDLHKVPGPKSTMKKTFASSKMDMDFDFDGGFSKLASFDIDLSFNSPPSPNKAKKTDPKKNVITEDEDNDLAFDLKGFNTLDVDLDDTIVKTNEKSQESGTNGELNMTCESHVPTHQASVTMRADRNQPESLGKGQTKDERNLTSNEKESPIPEQPDERKDTDSASPSIEPHLALGHHPVQDKVAIVIYEKSVDPASELTSTAVGQHSMQVLPTPSEGDAKDRSIFGSPSGLASAVAENLNPVLESGTRPDEDQILRPEASEPVPDNSRTNFSDQNHISKSSAHVPVNRQQSDEAMTLTRPNSSAIQIDGQKEEGTFLNPSRSETLQFDPLSKSSQNTVADAAVSENSGQNDNRHDARSLEATDTSRTRIVQRQGSPIHNPDDLTLPSTTSAMTVPIRDENSTGLGLSDVQVSVTKALHRRPSGELGGSSDTVQRSEVQNKTIMPFNLLPVVTALPLENSNEMEEEGDDEAMRVRLNQKQTVSCATLGDTGSDRTSTQAPAAPVNIERKQRGDHDRGRQSMVREGPNTGQVKLKTAPTPAPTGTIVMTDLTGISNLKEAKLDESKRPSRELFGNMTKLHSGSKRASQIYPEEDQGDSGRGTRVRAKKGRRQSEQNDVAGLSTTMPPVAGTRQGIQVHSPGINKTRADNQLSSRTLTTSKFFPTNGPRSTDREISSPLHIPSPELGKSSRLISSVSGQLRTPLQASALVGNKSAGRKINAAQEVIRSKGLEMNSSSREQREIKADGNNLETTIAKPRLHSSLNTSLQTFLPGKPKVEGNKSRAEKKTRHKGPSVERLEDPLRSSEKVQNQNLPMSTETQAGGLSAQGPADLMICQNDSIVDQSIQQTNKLEAMLKVMRKLDDKAKDLLVRALVSNNKLMMLNSPLTEAKIQKIKASVMEALGTDRGDKTL